ncbi:hypothetical protein ABC502_02750 [Alkalimonas sp. NCh-2]|uniref:hypothetical protein n=1 Tax=Alkalimonas sp. NCh-2 TaxID=3144846 RepID=UPI0031F5F316
MGPFEVAAIAIIGGLLYSAGASWYNHRSKSIANKEDFKALEDEVKRLKERVSTLESIVTDKSYQLKEQINRL